jgi:hypothetical protein
MDTKDLAHAVSGIIETTGICVLVIGGCTSVLRFFWFLKYPHETLVPYTESLARSRNKRSLALAS